MDTVVACPTSDKAAGRIKLSQLKGSARAAANNGLVPAMSALGVRRDKAALSSGCKPHPATAPAGSNRSSYGGDEVAEAFD
jgi:hypothetical protein